MKRRALVILIAAVAAIVAAVAYTRSGVAIVPGLVMVVFAMLGALAVLFVVRSLEPSPVPTVTAVETDSLRELRRLATEAKPNLQQSFGETRGPIEVYGWPEFQDTRQEPRTVFPSSVRGDDQTIARHLRERLAPPAPEMTPDLVPASRQEVLSELVREGEDLRSLGRMLELDLTAYGSLLSKGLAAARMNRLDECGLILQLANEKLRVQVQTALADELFTLRTRPSSSR
jgi:hypothetical protein